MDNVEVFLKAKDELYFSDKAEEFRKLLSQIEASLSEHQYFAQLLSKHYKATQQKYLEYLQLTEENNNGCTVQQN